MISNLINNDLLREASKTKKRTATFQFRISKTLGRSVFGPDIITLVKTFLHTGILPITLGSTNITLTPPDISSSLNQ